jgi:hypothetical protein
MLVLNDSSPAYLRVLTTTAGRIGHAKQQHHAFKSVDERKGARDADASRALLVGKFFKS